MATSPLRRRRRTCRRTLAALPALALAASMAAVLAAAACCFSRPVSMPVSSSRKRGLIHTRGQLPPNPQEIPRPEEEPGPEPEEPEPERRLPYTLHLVTQFGINSHLKENTNAVKWIREKIVHALEHNQDMIMHVEVRLKLIEGFHVPKVKHTMVPHVGTIKRGPMPLVLNEEDDLAIVVPKNTNRALTPFVYTAVVKLKHQGKVVVFSNPEHHAGATITEATDLMCHTLKTTLKEEKDKEIKRQRRRHRDDPDLAITSVLEVDEEEVEIPRRSRGPELEDARIEQEYEAVEAIRGPNAEEVSRVEPAQPSGSTAKASAKASTVSGGGFFRKMKSFFRGL
mmetsp:Transcript_27068/g.89904  ORF Transcript_27068/g.89904 Transcript_27068/m.89904 type:complete len:340 (+) Transcript_27068:67-1086(+)|eukprot:CAMPEP_0204207916 /NCGR_PEP_ID=MMETSP0361-20130328/72105_1 /ASSEMBLY_ACC=CAM_ASM_000343 /TAXON_ID=268821 /ORGANISM="Scrippsiella Hangoei, Strain SHTV-5" /LENGTH=339 /DNA_ID=CAMNT_0051171585 /DNA_START=102 /DNA_END=1121 /DNA_ORIENTATION=-